MSIRDEIRQLCAEHDRFMAEQASEPIRRPPVSESDTDSGLVFKTIEDATPSAPQPEPPASDAESYPPLDDFTKGICEFVVEWVRQKLAPPDERITKLEAQVEVLLRLLGKSSNLPDSKSADVVDLPDWRRKDVA
jgi:hypothetical protein